MSSGSGNVPPPGYSDTVSILRSPNVLRFLESSACSTLTNTSQVTWNNPNVMGLLKDTRTMSKISSVYARLTQEHNARRTAERARETERLRSVLVRLGYGDEVVRDALEKRGQADDCLSVVERVIDSSPVPSDNNDE